MSQHHAWYRSYRIDPIASTIFFLLAPDVQPSPKSSNRLASTPSVSSSSQAAPCAASNLTSSQTLLTSSPSLPPRLSMCSNLPTPAAVAASPKLSAHPKNWVTCGHNASWLEKLGTVCSTAPRKATLLGGTWRIWSNIISIGFHFSTTFKLNKFIYIALVMSLYMYI